MNRLAALLTVAAAIMVLSSCADIPPRYDAYDLSRDRTRLDDQDNGFVCRAHGHDFRLCR